MTILGVILLVLGLVFGINWLFIVGCVLAAVGVVLLLATAVSGGSVGGRRYWF